ncbi:hypothetical protein J4377_11750 [Halomonas sp. XH26]|uniref:hypothetical protein n=1 Tax=Halomonas sp. XH26 TaxID=2557993 RepID=UPI00209EB101|nr:hypothetical protein [Halomonas sp. XH26]UTA78640.1 hypothetical protein J4377_11750 [Halomonas sp. XH26]
MTPTDGHSRMPAALSLLHACRSVIPACLPLCHSRMPAALSFPHACRSVIPACLPSCHSRMPLAGIQFDFSTLASAGKVKVDSR